MWDVQEVGPLALHAPCGAQFLKNLLRNSPLFWKLPKFKGFYDGNLLERKEDYFSKREQFSFLPVFFPGTIIKFREKYNFYQQKSLFTSKR